MVKSKKAPPPEFEQSVAAKPVARRREREEDTKDADAERAHRRRRTTPGGHIETRPSLSDEEQTVSPRQGGVVEDEGLDEQFGRKAEKYLEAVVKVFCVHSEPNFSLPWQRKRQVSSTSSGFIIPGKRILTNAHSVDHHTQVKVRRRGSDTKFVAKVLAQGPECDIALLTVEDDAFWEDDITPVQFGKLPRLQDSVAVIGYPIGGDSISASSGVVSRIEVTNYSHGATALLGMQIDAAINSGNSGGPAFNDKGECAGIAFQTLKGEDAENIGYVIPVDVVQHFITDFERNGCFTSFPILGIDWQKMESKFLREALGMKSDQKGVLIREVEPTAAAAAKLRKGDVLLSFDGTTIANDGTVQFRSGERISFSYLVSKKFTNDKAAVEILRAGKVLKCELVLSAHNRLVPEHLSQRPPSYIIIAGFVFTQVTAPYLRSEYGKDYDFDSPAKLLNLLMHGKAQRSDQQVVVLGHVLAAECTVGYEDLQNYQVFKVNGQGITNLKDLVRIVDECQDKFLTFDLEYNATVIIDTAVARAATKAIMAMHYIAQDRSGDLQSARSAANGSTAMES